MDQHPLCNISRAESSPVISNAQVVYLALDCIPIFLQQWCLVEAEPGSEPSTLTQDSALLVILCAASLFLTKCPPQTSSKANSKDPNNSFS